MYIQGEVGTSRLVLKADKEDYKDTVTNARISVGKSFGNARYALDYTHFGKVKGSASDTYSSAQSDLTAQGIGISAIYDAHNQTALTPYVGIRAGLNRLSGNINSRTNNSSYSYSETSTQLGIGVLAGVQYQVNDRLALNVGTEYNYLGKLDGDKYPLKVHQYGALAGLRYNF